MSKVTEILSSLVSINSVNPEWGGPGESGVVDFLVEQLAASGIEFWRHEVLPGRSNLIARIPGKTSARAVALEAHMDTVSTGGMTIPPFAPTMQDGRLFGRGSCDTKAGLAAMLAAIQSLAGEGPAPPCDVYLFAVIDEEHAFRGALGAIEWVRGRGIPLEAVVVSEPTSLRLVTTNKGVLRFRIETTGRSAHSSTPHLGKNAISRMADVIQRVEAFQATLTETQHPLVGAATGCISLISGGDQINFVPEHCAISIDHRLLPGEAAEAVLARYRNLFTEEDVRVLPPDLADEAMETPPHHELVRVAAGILNEMDLPAHPVGVPFGCDVTKFSRAGIPGIIFGPGSIEQAHGAVEYVSLDEVEIAFDFYRRFLMNYGA